MPKTIQEIAGELVSSHYRSAIESCNSAILSRWDDLNPKDLSTLHTYRGFAYATLGNFTEAKQNYDEAIRLNPGNSGALCFHGELYRLKRKEDSALADYKKSNELKESIQALCF